MKYFIYNLLCCYTKVSQLRKKGKILLQPTGNSQRLALPDSGQREKEHTLFITDLNSTTAPPPPYSGGSAMIPSLQQPR